MCDFRPETFYLFHDRQLSQATTTTARTKMYSFSSKLWFIWSGKILEVEVIGKIVIERDHKQYLKCVT